MRQFDRNRKSSLTLETLETRTMLTTQGIVLTGHDIDLHFGQQGYDQVIVDYLRAEGTADEISKSQYSIAHIRSNIVATSVVPAGYPVTTFFTEDLAATPSLWDDVLQHELLMISSHASCGGCALTNQGVNTINLQSAEIETAFNSGMDIWANTAASVAAYYNFLPTGFEVMSGTIPAPFSGFSPTAAGAGIGITNIMVNGDFTHNNFTSFSSEYTVLETHIQHGAITLGMREAIVNPAPTIVDVRIGNESSVHEFYSFNGADADGTLEQIRTVPRGNPNAIEIEFSEDVLVASAVLPMLTPSGLVNLPLTSVSGNVARWTLDPNSSPFTRPNYFSDNGQFEIFMSSGSFLAVDNGSPVDGDWENPDSTNNWMGSEFPSGDGFGGGDFTFDFTITNGDSNRDWIVDGLDFNDWNFNKFQKGKNWCEADWNGDGNTEGLDFLIWNSHKFTSVEPSGLPSNPLSETYCSGMSLRNADTTLATIDLKRDVSDDQHDKARLHSKLTINSPDYGRGDVPVLVNPFGNRIGNNEVRRMDLHLRRVDSVFSSIYSTELVEEVQFGGRMTEEAFGLSFTK